MDQSNQGQERWGHNLAEAARVPGQARKTAPQRRVLPLITDRRPYGRNGLRVGGRSGSRTGGRTLLVTVTVVVVPVVLVVGAYGSTAASALATKKPLTPSVATTAKIAQFFRDIFALPPWT